MRRTSIVQWLTLLMLASGAVAWALSLALVLALPAPPVLVSSLSQVSGLLRSADLTHPHLARTIHPQAPIPPPSSPINRGISERLSRDLGGREVRAGRRAEGPSRQPSGTGRPPWRRGANCPSGLTVGPGHRVAVEIPPFQVAGPKSFR